MNSFNILKNNRGVLTIDYMFSFMLVSGFLLLIITLSATLSVVEVTQYITYASARNYFAANISEAEQKSSAARKFMELKNSDVLAPLYRGGWFTLNDDDVIIDYNIAQKYPQFSGYDNASVQFNPEGKNLFHGTVALFNAKILAFQIPFFGSTKTNASGQDTEESSFSSYIGSYLGREPTFDESNRFNQQRWQFIKSLSQTEGAPYSQAGNDQRYVVINDNGG
jgi:hypothetical protein